MELLLVSVVIWLGHFEFPVETMEVSLCLKEQMSDVMSKYYEYFLEWF
jgi:hypothetical protein